MTTTALDMSRDYLVWDNLEEVRVYPAPRLDATSFGVLNAKRRALSTRELIQGNGAYTGDDLVWLVPRAEMTQGAIDFVFRPGDIIRDQGDDPLPDVEYTVLSGAFNKLRQTWRLMTRTLALNANLADSITILRPLIAQGDAAEPVFRWDQAKAVVTGIPARVQPQTAAPQVTNDVETAATRYDVVLGQQVSLEAFDRFQATIKATGETVLLQWTEHRNAERLDELPLISCVRVG